MCWCLYDFYFMHHYFCQNAFYCNRNIRLQVAFFSFHVIRSPEVSIQSWLIQSFVLFFLLSAGFILVIRSQLSPTGSLKSGKKGCFLSFPKLEHFLVNWLELGHMTTTEHMTTLKLITSKGEEDYPKHLKDMLYLVEVVFNFPKPLAT